MAIAFKYLDEMYTFDQNYYEMIFCIFLLIDTLLMPVIIVQAQKKKKQILDPFINSSYSSISITILDLLVNLSYLQFLDGLSFIVYIAFFELYDTDPNSYEKWVLNIPIYIGMVTFALGQFLVIAQVYEYMIMIHSVLFQNGKTFLQVMKIFSDDKKKQKFRLY